MNRLATAWSAGKHDLQAAGFLRGRLGISSFRDCCILLVARIASSFAIRKVFSLFIILGQQGGDINFGGCEEVLNR